MTDPILYAIHKTRPNPALTRACGHGMRTNPTTGRFKLAFDNLTKDEAAEFLIETGVKIDDMVTERLITNAPDLV